MRPRRSLRLGLLGLTFVGLSAAMLAGCERKAPGPEECQRFAESAVRFDTGSSLITPELQADIDEATRLCLTKPYDRELLACVAATHQTLGCLASFQRRSRQRQ